MKATSIDVCIMRRTTRWIDFLHRVATGSRRVRNLLTPVGAIFFGLVLLLFVVTARYVDRWIGMTVPFPGRLSIVLSIPLFMIAAIMIGWSVYHFLMAKGTPVPINPPPRLVTSGPYAYSRNPMLTGVFALLFGLGVLLESISLLFVFTPIFIIINVWELKVIEEPELLKRLGGAYAEYRDKTPMFLPKIRKQKGGKR